MKLSFFIISANDPDLPSLPFFSIEKLSRKFPGERRNLEAEAWTNNNTGDI